MDANSTLISSKWKSHEISWISWMMLLRSWFQRNWQLVGDYMHHSTQQHLFLSMVEGFMNSGCFLTFPQNPCCWHCWPIGGGSQSGLGITNKSLPKSPGAAETIINNQEDDAAAINKEDVDVWWVLSHHPSIHTSEIMLGWFQSWIGIT